MPTARQETSEDSMGGLQSNFQNLNAKINQNFDVTQTDGHYQSICWNCSAILPKTI